MQSKNYIIDGDADGIVEDDFFTQLKNMMTLSSSSSHHHVTSDHCNTDNNNTEHEDQYCLLTKEPLNSVHIVLTCGHKFNYIPLYREVIAQKTIGLSSHGYFTSQSLKKNEIKCPYCRNIQDKLLPYLEYEGIKKLTSVNYPSKLSMTAQPCNYSAILKPNKNKKSSCKEHAIEYYNGIYVCKKHYELSKFQKSATPFFDITKNDTHCGVILRYGKNKGKPCQNSSSCRIHSTNNNNNNNSLNI